MRKSIVFVTTFIFLLFSFLLIGCNSTEPAGTTDEKDEEDLIIMPDKMPSDFNFSLKYGVHALEEINTFENTYTKDLVLDGTITTDLKLSTEEMNEIYRRMKEIELLATVQNVKYVGEDGSMVAVEPASDYYLTIQMNGQVYNYRWSSDIYDEEIRKKLAIFVNRFLHDEMIANKREFKMLPEASGSYQ